MNVQTFARGLAYARNGAIFAQRRRGHVLKARCRGSRGEAYRLWTEIDSRGRVVAAHCACPVGDGGYCKHVAALLLTWLAQPQTFLEQEELDSSLARRDKGELIGFAKVTR